MSERSPVTKFQTYRDLSRIGSKSYDGKVYRISDTEVAKVPHSHTLDRFGHEMMIAKRLHEAGVSVAEPLAWDYVSVPEISDSPIKAFIMEYVEGKTGFELTDVHGLPLERFSLASRLLEAEVKRSIELEFEPGEMNFRGNYILTPNDKIKLIDFATWKHPDIPNFDGVDPDTVFGRTE